MKHFYIFEAKCRNLKDKQCYYTHLYYGTAEGARAAADRYKEHLKRDGFTAIRVEIMLVKEKEYCGSIRGVI